ncbi:DUF3489 domain-containing protein [Roseococcus sp. SYP-B2431]|uniref:DUF3489 domain-containing protein n=1 Tax=Roseococcus sp. SYP-B2431 TaxID=2496640 RepID=UPI00103D07BC|nr:DUF3489 domain-containing protein [Roseococcus sp. SYP-B2431]TCI00781.1 DUF3489 domain-containing protein [Roseococcus sp. SYP-B2431]
MLLADAPSSLPAAARQAVMRSMLKNMLLEEVPAPAEHGDLAWRLDEGGVPIVLRATAGGLRAIGIEPGAPGEIGCEPRELTQGEEAEELALQQEALAAENAAEEALETAEAPRTRHGLREAASAAVAAWEAQDGLEAALGALKAALGRTHARADGGPRRARAGTKQEAVLTLLRRGEGATIAQVMEATAWQQHTIRGFFAGLKKKGHTVEVLERVKQVGSGKQGAKGSYSIYRVTSPAVIG